MAYTRSAIVTGGSINLGYFATLEIAREHPDWLVVICSRSDKENAVDKINKTLNQQNVVFMPLDLSVSTDVRAFVEKWTSKKYPPIQSLILNAALQFPDEIVYTKEGIEATFAICHVGHALLFHLLYPQLAEKARVVVTSSGVHDPALGSGFPEVIFTTTEELAHPPPAIANGPGRRHYCNSKFANIMWTYVLQRKLNEKVPERGITVNAFDPGLMPGSGLAREYSAAFRFAWNKIFPRITPVLKAVYTPNIHKPSESGASLARLAASDEMAGVAGKYFEGRKEIKSSALTYDKKKQEDLWQWTVKYCGGDDVTTTRMEAFQV